MSVKSILAKIKLFFTPEFESNDHPTANNSRYLAFAQIIVYIVGIFLPALSHQKGAYGLGFTIVETLLFVSTIITAIGIGFHNKLETNDDYKTGVQVASLIASILVPIIFLISSANKIG